MVLRKGNVEKTVCIVYCYKKVQAVLTGQLTIRGFDLAWFSALTSWCLCIFDLYGAVYIVNFYVFFFFVYCAESGGIGPRHD